MLKKIGLVTLAFLLISCQAPVSESNNEVKTKEEAIIGEVLEVRVEDAKYLSDPSLDDVTLKSAYQVKIGHEEIYLSSIEIVELFIESLLNKTASSYKTSVDVTISKTFEVITSIGEKNVLEIGFLEDIEISEVKVNGGTISDLDEAILYFTTPFQAQVAYQVKAGDVPSLIAEQFEMGLSELYHLNPGLESKTQSLRIGESIIIEEEYMPANVYVIMEKAYEESIPKGFTYVENPEKYQGSQSTISYGSDGMKTILSKVKIVNDKMVSEEILDIAVLSEPQDAVISRGTRQLPDKGSLGHLIYPVEDYRLTSGYGLRWNRSHRGIDMAVVSGSTVMASDGGTVTRSEWDDSYGYFIEIDHGYAKTRYAHNSQLLVHVGQVVSQYEVIALSGNTGNSTGPHLHFEVIIDGIWVNPLDYLN